MGTVSTGRVFRKTFRRVNRPRAKNGDVETFLVRFGVSVPRRGNVQPFRRVFPSQVTLTPSSWCECHLGRDEKRFHVGAFGTKRFDVQGPPRNVAKQRRPFRRVRVFAHVSPLRVRPRRNGLTSKGWERRNVGGPPAPCSTVSPARRWRTVETVWGAFPRPAFWAPAAQTLSTSPWCTRRPAGRFTGEAIAHR